MQYQIIIDVIPVSIEIKSVLRAQLITTRQNKTNLFHILTTYRKANKSMIKLSRRAHTNDSIAKKCFVMECYMNCYNLI